ncbi:MAG: hypothetical protein RL177_8 [Bacteroidota bacterium]|jgi:hypothetical protein
MTEGLPYYDALLARALELAESHDWQTGFDEFDILKNRWSEGPEVDDVPAKDAKYNELLEALKRYAERRKAHYDQLNERRTVNAQRREDLIKRLSDLIDAKRWANYAEVASIQHKFEEIRPLPTDHEEQDKRFAALLETFNHHKVEYLVKVRQREDENLLLKLTILEKMKQHTATLSESTVWADADAELEVLSDQWRKVGKVAKEKSDEVWESFKQVRDAYSDFKLQHDSKYRSELEKNQHTRLELCEKAEALLTETDLAVAAKEMNLLHKRWKETGPTFRDQSETLWERFKAASDQFNNVKHENLDVIRDAEQHNYEAKEALCVKAEALSSGDSKDHGHDVIESLFKEWNAIGPVPRRKNKKIWARFKTAIDAYQTHRRSHFKQARIEQKDNLTRKREIIDKLTAMAEAEVTDTTAAELKQLQQEFQSIGFVPIKLKEKVWTDYRTASDAVYKKVRAAEGPSTPRPQQSSSPRPQAHRPSSHQAEPRSDAYRLKKEAESVNEMMLHYIDAITYIKPNKSGNVLREEIQAKIDAAKVQLDKLKAEIEALNK